MPNEYVALAAILASVAGAAFAVWWNTPDKTPVSHAQLAKALALAAFGAVALVNVSLLPSTTDPSFSWIGTIVLYLLAGSGIGKASNHLTVATATS